MTNQMSGKVCMVTGATSGIGNAIARGLAARGATVVAIGRDRAKGEKAVAEIVSRTGNPNVELLLCDLSSQRSIREAVGTFKASHERLHVLVNQAGLYTAERRVTEDGLETMFAVNHLAYFLLTNLLLDVLEKSAPARVIIGTGGVEAMGKIHFDDLGFEKKWKPFAALAQSKLANTLFTHELARRVEARRITVNAFHPGGVKTNLATGEGGPFGMMMAMARLFGSTPEQAAETPVRLASDPEFETRTALYFNVKKPGVSSAQSRDPELGRRFWEVSAQLTGLA